VFCVAEPVKPKSIVTAHRSAAESVAVIVSVPPSSAIDEVIAIDDGWVAISVAVADDDCRCGAMPLLMLTVRSWLLVVPVFRPVSVVEPVLAPEAIVIVAGLAE